MKKNKVKADSNNLKIIVVDNEPDFVDSLSNFLKRLGYDFTIITNPSDAIKRVKSEHFDMMILDFMVDTIHNDKIVEKIRKFNKEIYILLLINHSDLSLPLDTIKRLDIQGYCEKSNRFDQLLFSIESGIKFIKHINRIKDTNIKLKNKSKELEQSYLDTIGILRQTVEAKDPYTRGHSDRVSEYSVLVGKKMKLDDKTLHILKIGRSFS